MADEMSLDQFLAQQAQVKPLATVELIPEKADLVKMTPWAKETGCLCVLALTVPKSVVKSVKPIGETHYCCGKRLDVVEVTFNTNAQISVADVFAQATSAASQQSSLPPQRMPSPVTSPCMPCQPAQFPGLGWPPYQGVPTLPVGWPPKPPPLPHCHWRGSCDPNCVRQYAPGCLDCFIDPTGDACITCAMIAAAFCCNAKWVCD